ncbi:deoxynucleoside kinase [Jeotgalibacillus proteolyticus]|uniref:Deoxynucleoside kinase n=1 Tax=Jeotgalibacillus proteolyticus TaxID=2082395 RepID=A0A2S5G631_9BACL|nr:deoxynucleoside kinase [Jeotgalibacillus proteolyticus]PPA68415.1 deoxynucleoside kinase [Jeotgalibacillus proteolyticus]
MTSVPFVTVEGPIGVGKTSLANAISSHFQFHLLKEIVDENPFLDKFYDNIDEWSFQTEMFFLCNRYKQLSDIQRLYLESQKPVVADYHIFKNIIFAKRTLQPEEYKKYLEIYRIMTSDMPKPNVVVYLHASLDTLLKRIKMRGRGFEKNMSHLYLEQLAADYEEFILHFEQTHPEIPVIRVNGDDVDFVHKEQDLTSILKQVENSLPKRSTTL